VQKGSRSTNDETKNDSESSEHVGHRKHNWSRLEYSFLIEHNTDEQRWYPIGSNSDVACELYE